MHTKLIAIINELVACYGSDDGRGPIPIIEKAKRTVIEADAGANHEFVNRIRSLYNIDRDLLPELTHDQWIEFRANPPRYLCGTDRTQTAAILREVEKRQKF